MTSARTKEAPPPNVAAMKASRPPALVASVVFGVIGGVLLGIGFVTRSTPVLVFSGLGGALSLASALVWRSQLIDAWRAEHGRPSAR